MATIKQDMEEQVFELAEKKAIDVYGQQFYDLPSREQDIIRREAAQVVREKWNMGLTRIQERLNATTTTSPNGHNC